MAFETLCVLTRSRKRIRFFGIWCFLALCWLASASTARASSDPTLAPGWSELVAPVVEEGGRGIVFFPASFAGSEVIEYLDPTGFRAHFSNHRGDESVHPAGRPILPPAGRWMVWLQGEWTITPFPRVFVFPTTPQEGLAFPQALPVWPAGRVAVPEDLLEVGAGMELSLVFTGVPPWGGPPREFRRQRSARDSGTGILMPAGEILAFLGDPREESYVAVSRPFETPPGQTIAAPLGTPGPAESWLVVELRRGDEARGGTLEGFVPRVVQEGGQRRADVTVTSDCCVHGLWYSLDQGPAFVEAGNSEFYLAPRSIELAAGRIHRFEGELLPRPMLDVSMVLPPLLRERPFSLQVWRMPQEEKLAEARLPKTAGHHRFTEELVRGLLEIRLVTHVGVFRQRVDLSAGGESFVGLQPELMDADVTIPVVD